ncbi:MAG: hypothetical protein RI885_1712 [Actinomycetota bacterium]|jgi:heme/copper-type cytochrome/quinol oxidase subunit 2
MSVLGPVFGPVLGVAAEVAEHSDTLPFPSFVFAIISAGVFVALAFVVWSFRDVANRHAHKTSGQSGHGSDHH